MSASHVQGGSKGSVGIVASLSITLSGVTVGNVLRVAVVTYSGGIIALSDGSNAYVLQNAQINGNYDLQSYAAQVTTGGTLTLVLTPGASPAYCSIAWDEYVPTAVAAYTQDGAGSNNGAGTSGSTGDVTITSTDIAYACCQLSGQSISSAGSGFTIRQNLPYIGGTQLSLATADALNVSSSPIDPSFTFVGSQAWTALVDAFHGSENPPGSVAVTAQLGKTGKLVRFLTSTSRAPFKASSVTAVNSNPTIKWNGSTVDLPLFLNALKITAAGTGYTQATTTAAITGGTGNGAACSVTVSGGHVTALTITNGGAGYAIGDTLTLTITDSGGSPGTGATATATVGPYWTQSSLQQPYVTYQLPVGSLVGVNVTPGAGYVSPTASISGGSPGTAATLGTPTMASGVTSYTVTAGGSGYTSAPAVAISGGGSGINAKATAVISGGAVTAIHVAAIGTNQATPAQVLGTGYSGSVTVTLSGGGGTLATATGTVSNYITGVPISTAGSGYLGLPTITITDADGTGATAAAFMSGAGAEDTLTYSAANGWLSTAAGNVGPANAGTAISNYVGGNEPGIANFSDFGPVRDTDTFQVGFNIGTPMAQALFPAWMLQNWRMRMSNPMQCSSGTLVSGTDGTPIGWPTSSYIYSSFAALNTINTIDQRGVPTPSGTWTVIYDETTPAEPMVLRIYQQGGDGGTTVGVDPITGPTGARNGTSPNFGIETIVGDTHTIVYENIYKSSVGVNLDMLLGLAASSPTGSWTASNLWIFAPGTTDFTRTNPARPNEQFVKWMTTPSGKGPSVIRFMSCLLDFNAQDNSVLVDDGRQLTDFSWNTPANRLISVVAVRYFNTNPGSAVYPWSSPKIYSDQFGYAGTDGYGNYLNLSTTDNGSFMSSSPIFYAAEARTASAHGLRGGQYVTTGTGPELPVSLGTNGTGTVSLSNISVIVWPTSSTTFVWTVTVAGTAGESGPQKVVSNLVDGVAQEYTASGGGGFTLAGMPFNFQVQQPISSTLPIEACAQLVSTWSNTAFWCNIGLINTDGLVHQLCTRAKPYLGSGNKVMVELSNEVWNESGSQQQYALSALGQLMAYQTPGMTIGISGIATSTYYTVPSSPIALGPEVFYALRAAQVHDTAASVFGDDNVVRVFGSQNANQGLSAQVMSALNGTISGQTGVLRASVLSTAPYTNPPFNEFSQDEPLWTAACDPLYGNWSCDMAIEEARYYTKYNTNYASFFTETFTVIQTYVGGAAPMQTPGGLPIQIAYEGCPTSVGNPQASNAAAFVVDCNYHPSIVDLEYAWYRFMQDGDVNNPGSGFQSACVFDLAGFWVATTMWERYYSQITQAGPGTGMTATSGGTSPQLFTTLQGGLTAANGQANELTNDSPKGYAWQLWGDTANPANSPPPSPTSTRRWFPGLNRLLRAT